MRSRIIIFILAAFSVFAVEAAGQRITASTYFKGRTYAGSDKGELFFIENDELHKLKMDIKGEIVSLSATDSQCFGVTSEGVIFNSQNGTDWTILDFNGYYSGFYDRCEFVAVAIGNESIAVLGKEDDGKPVLYTSSKGTVWAARELKYKDGNDDFILAEHPPVGLDYNKAEDEFIIIFEFGRIMTVPTCSHCNKLLRIGS